MGYRKRRAFLKIVSVLAVFLTVMHMVSTLSTKETSAASQVTYAVKGGKIYFDKSTGSVTGADKNITEAKIPKKISKVTVKGIEKAAFKNCSKLKKVTLPGKLKTIGDEAFYGCSELLYIDIPSKVTKIGKRAFSNCTSLIGVGFAKKSKALVENSSFSSCPSLERIVNCPDCEWGEVVGSLRRAIHYLEDPEVFEEQNELWWLQGDTEKEKEIEKLVKTITKGCKTDREKAEAICIWVVDHIEYETGTGLSYNPWDVYQRIMDADKSGKSGKTSCFGYSRLTQILFQTAGIPCVTIYQDLREDQQINHEFNIAYFEGKWRFIDNTDSDWVNSKLDCFDMSLGDMPAYRDHRADMIVYVEEGENEYAYLYGRRRKIPKDKKLNDAKDW